MRRAAATKRKIDPDPVFRNVLVSRVINKVLWKGKKDLARRIVYAALERVEQRTRQDPVSVLRRAIENL
ncbi:MAG: 30S ribosomal protein S7, partial [bacterium]|nr:30S ribosomal protein S7 [bacterium]